MKPIRVNAKIRHEKGNKIENQNTTHKQDQEMSLRDGHKLILVKHNQLSNIP